MIRNGIVTKLTPELADKIWKSIEKKRYDERVSKEHVLHHLKQLKAQMGKEKKKYHDFAEEHGAILTCMDMIDKKITKIKNQQHAKSKIRFLLPAKRQSRLPQMRCYYGGVRYNNGWRIRP